MDYYPGFAQLLNQYLHTQERTPTWLAKRLRLHPATVNRWLNQGTRPGDPTVIGQIADLLCIHATSERQALLVAAGYGYQAPPSSSATVVSSLATQRQTPQPMMQAASCSATVDWGEAPDVGYFQGRQAELTQLTHWLVDDYCRLVAVLGLGGIGKTVLATQAAALVHSAFACVVWRSLRNAPPVEELLADCLQLISPYQVPELPTDVDKRLGLLLTYLGQQRCLLILDNFETVLDSERVGYYRPGYEGYGQLLQQIGQGRHQSCVLLTSREKPKELGLLAGETAPVRTQTLGSLPLADSRTLLHDRGLAGSDQAWAELHARCSGNPLALQIVAETIRELFAGDIATCLQQGPILFASLADLLAQQFGRLSPLEREIMLWLAIAREPVEVEELRCDLVESPSPLAVLEALRALRLRSLVERTGTGFTLHNVVLEYVTTLLIDQGYTELTSGQFVLLQRHALFKAQAKSYVRESQRILLLTPLVHQLVARLGKPAAVTQMHTLLAVLRQTQLHQPGYAGGNLLNLLVQLEGKLCSLDFSHLAIWQADLRGVNAQDVDFRQSDLTHSVFTDTFAGVLNVAFSPNGERLAVGTLNGEIRVWTINNRTLHWSQTGHIGWVWSISFSPTADVLASGGMDQTVHLWDAQTGHCLHTLRGHNNDVRAVCFSPDGQILASASFDQTVRLWDVATGQCVHILQDHTGAVNAVCFSPDGHTLASGGDDRTVRLWNVATGQCLAVWSGHPYIILSLAYRADGNQLATGSQEPTVRVWDAHTGHCLHTWQGHTGWVFAVRYSPDGCLLASGSDDETIRLWDSDTGHCLHTVRGSSICFHPDGERLASGSVERTVQLWEVQSGHCLHTLQGYTNPFWCFRFSPDNQHLASGSDDGVVRVWDVYRGQCVQRLLGHTDWVWCLNYTSDGQHLATASRDQTIRVWAVQSGQCLYTLQGHTAWVNFVSFNADGQLLASSSDDQTVRVWAVHNGQCLHTLQGHTNIVGPISFSPMRDILASGSGDHTVRLWDIHTGHCLYTLHGHRDTVVSLCFSTDGRRLVSSSLDHTVRLWDINTSQCLYTLYGHTNGVRAVCFSPDNQHLASGSDDQTIRVWDAHTGNCLCTLQGHTSGVRSVCFSPDGNQLVSGSMDQTVRLWDPHNGQCLSILRGHANEVFNVNFSPDGHWLASGSYDETIKLWDGQAGHCVQTLRNDRPYERMNITQVTGLTSAQIATLKMLGAIEDPNFC